MDFLSKLDGEIMIELGEHLKQLRKNHFLSQQELALRIGVSRKLIVDIEAGRGTSLLVFVKLLKTFKKENQLLELLEEPASNKVSPKEIFLQSQ